MATFCTVHQLGLKQSNHNKWLIALTMITPQNAVDKAVPKQIDARSFSNYFVGVLGVVKKYRGGIYFRVLLHFYGHIF